MKSNYQADVEQENDELRQLLDQREGLEIEIAKKRSRIAALMVLADRNEEIDQVVGMALGGLTDACRTAFRSVWPDSLTPIQVRSKLAQLGFPVDFYKNVMAAIHTVIGRLDEAGQIEAVKSKDGEAAYKWAVVPSDHPARKLAEGARFGKRERR